MQYSITDSLNPYERLEFERQSKTWAGLNRFANYMLIIIGALAVSSAIFLWVDLAQATHLIALKVSSSLLVAFVFFAILKFDARRTFNRFGDGLAYVATVLNFGFFILGVYRITFEDMVLTQAVDESQKELLFIVLPHLFIFGLILRITLELTCWLKEQSPSYSPLMQLFHRIILLCIWPLAFATALPFVFSSTTDLWSATYWGTMSALNLFALIGALTFLFIAELRRKRLEKQESGN